MNKILKPFFLISALLLVLVPLIHANENGTNLLIKSHSAFDYQQTREHLLKAISDIQVQNMYKLEGFK
ncbi:hypothetical protein ACFLXR_004489 [Salmonella enterica]